MEYTIDLKRIFRALLKKFPLIMAAAVVFFLGATALTFTPPPNVYLAQTTIYGASYSSYKDSVEGWNAMRDYVDIVSSRKVAERAAASLTYAVTPDQIMGMVSADYDDTSVSGASRLIKINARSTDPDLAVAVANAITDAFVYEVQSITASSSVKTLDSAYRAVLAINGNRSVMMFRLGATLAGGLAACVLVVLRTVFDQKVTSVDEVTLHGELELLAVLPDYDI